MQEAARLISDVPETHYARSGTMKIHLTFIRVIFIVGWQKFRTILTENETKRWI